MSDQPQPAVSIGLDVGKSDHHAVAVTSTGQAVQDKARPNDETRLRSILEELAAAHGPWLMVVDQPATIGALPVADTPAQAHQALEELMDTSPPETTPDGTSEGTAARMGDT